MIVEKYPEMIREAIEASKNLDLPKFEFDKIVFCGIGGSLIVGNFIKDLLNMIVKNQLKFLVIIDYLELLMRIHLLFLLVILEIQKNH